MSSDDSFDMRLGVAGPYLRLRQLRARAEKAEAEVAVARNGIAQAVEELGDHRQDPATEGMKRGMCVLCGAADGQWPCVTAMVRADLARLLTEDNQT